MKKSCIYLKVKHLKTERHIAVREHSINVLSCPTWPCHPNGFLISNDATSPTGPSITDRSLLLQRPRRSDRFRDSFVPHPWSVKPV